MVYTHTQKYYSVIKNTKILPFAVTWIDLANIMLSEITWKEKVEYSVITYIWNLKIKQMDKYNETNTVTENKLAVSSGERES